MLRRCRFQQYFMELLAVWCKSIKKFPCENKAFYLPIQVRFLPLWRNVDFYHSSNRNREFAYWWTPNKMSSSHESLPAPDKFQDLPVLQSPVVDLNNDDYEPELVDLLRAVECPICRCIPNPPIYNCLNGHFSCSLCVVRLTSNRCGYCSAKFTKMRNYPLENILSSRVFLCDFRSVGCMKSNMTMTEYEDHMTTCWYRSISQESSKKILPRANLMCSSLLNELRCPRCSYMNSKRKVKCQNCEINLRVATPMCSRSTRMSSGNMMETDSY